jgi:hypothetical protein
MGRDSKCVPPEYDLAVNPNFAVLISSDLGAVSYVSTGSSVVNFDTRVAGSSLYLLFQRWFIFKDIFNWYRI